MIEPQPDKEPQPKQEPQPDKEPQPQGNILISACLLGQKVRYDGKHNSKQNAWIRHWQQQGRLIPICPEMAGGLPTPRPPAEIIAGSGQHVLRQQAEVRTHTGDNVTDAFTLGAQRALALAQQHNCQLAILTERSPSCGSEWIHDGQFGPGLIPGEGVTTALLRQHGIRVLAPERLDEVFGEVG